MKYHVYKRKRNGKRAKAYTLRYRHDDGGPWQTKALEVTNKAVAEQKAKQIIEQMEREAAGLVLPRKQVQTASVPLLDLVKEYARSLATSRRNRQYVYDQANRLERLAAECGWSVLRDMTADNFEEWRQSEPLCVMGKRKGKPLSVKTLNDYRDAAYAFCAWLVKRDRVSINPMERIEKLRGRPTFERWAMTPAQAGKLLEHAGPRAVLYLAALMTSYRRGTLYRLTWACVDLGCNRSMNGLAA